MNDTKSLFAVQLRTFRKVKDQEDTLVPPKSWLIPIAQYLCPVGAVAFEKSLIKVKDRVRGKEQIHDSRVKRRAPHNIADHEKLFRKFSWLPWTLFNVYLIDIVAKHDIHAGGDDL